MADLKDMFGSDDAETFLNLPRARDLSRTEADVVILGAPCATPYKSVGAYCAEGPRAIRSASSGLAERLTHINFDLGGPIFPGPVRVVDAGEPMRAAARRRFETEASTDVAVEALRRGVPEFLLAPA